MSFNQQTFKELINFYRGPNTLKNENRNGGNI